MLSFGLVWLFYDWLLTCSQVPWKWVGWKRADSFSTKIILCSNCCLSSSVFSIQPANKTYTTTSKRLLFLLLSIAFLSGNQNSDINFGERKKKLWHLTAGILRELSTYHLCSAISFPWFFLILRELTWMRINASSGWTSFTSHQPALG